LEHARVGGARFGLRRLLKLPFPFRGSTVGLASRVWEANRIASRSSAGWYRHRHWHGLRSSASHRILVIRGRGAGRGCGRGFRSGISRFRHRGL
jgi:hypothetical protein